ncbi:MAG: S-methyl-5-thioribose-1-phosphate isomerase [Chloroflexota bacterium]|nr:S-methyl-5-thioribose-1-phosphate isomerase [Chloroflexota bacterium]
MAEGVREDDIEGDGDGERDIPPPGVDLGRRRFFRQLAADVFQATATVVGAASALQQQSMQAANAILDPEAAALAANTSAAAPGDGPARGFRTAFRLDTDRLILVDQRELPARIAEIECRTGGDVTWAIREMVVRGAPAIGQAAAYGLALTAGRAVDLRPFARRATIRAAATALRNARPTAANLGWAIDRMLARLEAVGSLEDDGSIIADALRAEADAICAEATRDHGLLAEHGLARLPTPVDRPLQVLTHCNTGPLACGQFGTAMGVVQAAVHAGRQIHVHVGETRPYLQGARLTAWELEQAGVPYTLIADSAAGALLASGAIDAVLVGADRVAANGDTANKIGTYPLAALAARHRVPFYVCAPLSSVDLETVDGSAIPIEERSPGEILSFGGVRVAPPGAMVWNPAFDVTPADLISAIVTEEGALVAPFGPALAAAVEAKRARSAPAAAPSQAASTDAADPTSAVDVREATA